MNKEKNNLENKVAILLFRTLYTGTVLKKRRLVNSFYWKEVVLTKAVFFQKKEGVLKGVGLRRTNLY